MKLKTKKNIKDKVKKVFKELSLKKQAGAELGQAQNKLGLDFTTLHFTP